MTETKHKMAKTCIQNDEGSIIKMTNLKICPFCGYKPELHSREFSEITYYHIKCTACGVATKSDTDGQEVIKNWNKRNAIPHWCRDCNSARSESDSSSRTIY